MSPTRPPSLEIPEHEKRGFSEAEIHSTLFERDMRALGYPPRESSQADGEYFREQRTLALRRLRTQRETGRYDGLYLVANQPVVLCELKRYGQLDTQDQLDRAARQLQEYARSEDFASPPPFLILYSGRLERTRFYRLGSWCRYHDDPGRDRRDRLRPLRDPFLTRGGPALLRDGRSVGRGACRPSGGERVDLDVAALAEP